MSRIDLRNDAVPDGDPGPEIARSRSRRFPPERLGISADVRDHARAERTVIVALDLDVP